MPVNLAAVTTLDELLNQVSEDHWREVIQNWRAGRLAPFLGAKTSPIGRDQLYLHYADEPYVLRARDVIFVLADQDQETTRWREDWARKYSDRVIIVAPPAA